MRCQRMSVFDKPAGGPDLSLGPCVHYEGNILNTHKGTRGGRGKTHYWRCHIGQNTRGIGGVTLEEWGL